MSSLSDGAFALLSAAKPVAIGYAITCGIAFVAQRKLQYFPTVDAPELPSGDFSFAAVEEFEVFARDGTRCLGWRMPAPARGAEPVAPWWLGEKAAAALLPRATKVPDAVIAWATEAARAIASPYATVDVSERAGGGWFCLEGAVHSVHSPAPGPSTRGGAALSVDACLRWTGCGGDGDQRS